MNSSPCARRGYASLILCIRIFYSIIRPHVKFQSNQTNINIVISIQSSLNLIHWPLFDVGKEGSFEIEGFNFHK